MSKYGWEKGTLKIPGNEWKRVRDAIVEGHNKRQDTLFALATELHARLVAIKGAKGSAGIQGEISTVLRADSGSYSVMKRLEQAGDDWDVLKAVRKFDTATKKTTLTVPKKKDFAHVPFTKAEDLSYDDFGISFDHKEKSIRWSVQDNNHSVERARDHEMGRLFFKVMDSVKWVRCTGGQINGNDEYNRDSEYEGGGGNYVTARYGPLGGDKVGVKAKARSYGFSGHSFR
jgi:hypothetical protein